MIDWEAETIFHISNSNLSRTLSLDWTRRTSRIENHGRESISKTKREAESYMGWFGWRNEEDHSSSRAYGVCVCFPESVAGCVHHDDWSSQWRAFSFRRRLSHLSCHRHWFQPSCKQAKLNLACMPCLTLTPHNYMFFFMNLMIMHLQYISYEVQI